MFSAVVALWSTSLAPGSTPALCVCVPTAALCQGVSYFPLCCDGTHEGKVRFTLTHSLSGAGKSCGKDLKLLAILCHSRGAEEGWCSLLSPFYTTWHPRP